MGTTLEIDVQLQVPLPSALRAPSLAGSTEAVEEMLITRPGSTLVESLASRSERLRIDCKSRTCYASTKIFHPAVTDFQVIRVKKGHVDYKKQHTVKDAFHVDVEDIVPTLLFRKV